MADVLVLGADGYIGYSLYASLRADGIDAVPVDNLSGRDYRGDSVVPIGTPGERFGDDLLCIDVDTQYGQLLYTLEYFEPESVINLAQIPSAPYSMRGIDEAWRVFENNVRGSLNLYHAIHELGLDTHVVQLATMGEYPAGGDIPEGFLPDGRPAPKDPGSLYHASKVDTTVNTLFLSRLWSIPTTGVYQGIVYGLPEWCATRFDADEAFGTVLNRFTAQAAVGHPLTVYGAGGQKRAMLSITDSVGCLRLLIDNPPAQDYRAVNQFDGAYRVRELAEMVADETGAAVEWVDNPRVENDSDHAYDPQREVLDALGYEPARSIREEFERTFDVVSGYADRIDPETLRPTTTWD